MSTVAGEILSALERTKGTMRLAEFAHRPSCSRDVVLMALGWLYQEGLITVHPVIGDWLVRTRVGEGLKAPSRTEEVSCMV